MTYLVKDTFQYTGDLEFATLDDFVNYFWQGTPSDVLAKIVSYLTPDQSLNFSLLQTGIVEHSWNPETKVYTRIVDFGSAVDYLTCRIAVDYMRDSINNATLVLDDDVREVMTSTLNLEKTTEFIG